MKNSFLLRSYEILLSVIILIVFSIPLFVLVILKLIADGQPLFYNSQRIGKDRTSFTVFKFRSMITDRRMIESYLNNIKAFGFEKIPLDAPLYTTMGRIFEKFQIVEVLQIFNVLIGNMSLIGYRPLPVVRVIQLEEELGAEKIKLRHSVKPGITGISQIIGKSTLTNVERVNLENNYSLLLRTQPQLTIIYYNTLIIIETLIQIMFKKSILINYINEKISRNYTYRSISKKTSKANYYKRSLYIFMNKGRIAS